VGGSGLEGGVIACSPFGPCHVGIDALVGDADRVAALAGGGAGEGAVELLDIDAALTQFALDGSVHGRKQLGAQLVQDLVDINVGQTASRLFFAALPERYSVGKGTSHSREKGCYVGIDGDFLKGGSTKPGIYRKLDLSVHDKEHAERVTESRFITDFRS
jgi:hypothetical protein